MSNPARACAVLMALLCASCKTQRTETWTTVNTDAANPFGARMFKPLEGVGDLRAAEQEVAVLQKQLKENPDSRRARRKLGKAMEELSAQREQMDHPMTADRSGGPESIFGGERGSSQGDKSLGRKMFGREEYDGTNEFKADDYHFLRERELAREASAAADKSYLGGDRKAGESGRRWFGRERRADAGPLVDGDKRYPTGGYRDAETERLPSEETEDNIIRGAGSGESGGDGMSIDDVRSLLGRGLPGGTAG